MSIIPPQYPDNTDIDTRSSAVDDDTDAGNYPLVSERMSSLSSNEPEEQIDDYLAFKADASEEEHLDHHQRRQVRRYSRSAPEGISYTLFKYPLLIIIGLIMGIELVIYVLVRQYVNIYEYLFTFWGQKLKLRQRLRQATTYEQWAAAAQAMDDYLKFGQWKKAPESSFYDYRLIRRMTRLLKQYRQGLQPSLQVVNGMEISNQAQQLSSLNRLKRVLLDGGCKSNLAGIENISLYSRCYFGTKELVDEYVDEVCQSLQAVHQSPLLPAEVKQKFFKKADRSYGKSALCLSGGACLGYYHLGVLKALIDEDCLPRVITGTSAGSLIAAFACTRNDEEMKRELVPDIYQYFTACDQTWPQMLKRGYQTGAAFDPDEWIRKLSVVTRADMTFMEAYEHSGRILNISVIPMEEHSPAKLLNYKTTPDIVIWSAVLASSAVPGILPPMELRRKLQDGRVVLYHEEGQFWRDGSIRIDVPTVALHQMFHVNHTVVSQVNPHISLFFFDHKGSGGKPTTHRSGRGWRGGFLASYMEHSIKLDLLKWLRTIRDLSLLPQSSSTSLLQSMTSIFLQKFDGSITILPKSQLKDYYYILTDPTLDRMKNYITKGQQNTWPKLAMIRNRMRIELTIYKLRSQYK